MDIADAILAEIVAQAWDVPFAPRRHFRIARSDEALLQAVVTVIPATEIQSEMADRGEVRRNYPSAVLLQKVIDRPDVDDAYNEECAILAAQVEALAAFFEDHHRLASMPTYWIEEVSIPVLFSPVDLQESNFFNALIEVKVGNIR